jgi:PAS domain S-box-containing protein
MEDKDKSKETPSLTGNQDKIEGTTSSDGDTRKSLRQASNKVKLMLILLSVFVYVASFLLIHYTWDYGMGIVALIPVIVVAWLYGCVPGMFVALLTFFANIIMREFIGQDWMTRMLEQGAGILGTVAFMFIGGIIGRLSDLRMQLREELYERKRTEKEIKESRDFLGNIFKTSVDGILVTGPQGVITMANEAVEKMLSYSKGELIGKRIIELPAMIEGYEEKARKLVEELNEKGFVVGEEQTWFKKDESLIDLEISAVLLKDKKGDNIAGVATIRDITERKKFEDTLKISEEKYRSLIENANDAIISLDEEFLILDFNKKAEEMYGYAREEVMGKPIFVLSTPTEREKEIKQIEAFKKNRELRISGTTVEREQLRKDGTIFLVESSTFAIELHGKYVFTAFLRDITERSEMEQKLLQSEKLKSLGELAGGVAHDFNNVLAAILGRVQLLKMRIKAPLGKQEKRKSVLELKKGLEIIEKATLDGAETVRRIQEFSRKRVDDKNFTQVDINELIDNALEFTRIRWKSESESKGIKIRIKKELSPLSPTLGSSSELREVFTNLINNAIDAMPQGGEIKIGSFMDDTIAVVRIKDTGNGIPEKIRERIFDPFFTTKDVKSTGLGLSVSYGIINRHHGTIAVDSVEGKGTAFTVKLPITKKTVERDVKEEKSLTAKTEKKKARILVIEDEEDIRQLLRDILTNVGHEVEIAADGSEGIKIFEKKEFDLVFTDLGMPGMSGWQVAEKVKNINGKVPVALITGWNVKLEMSDMEDSGISLVIHKPFKMEQVLNLVQEGMILRDKFKAV